VKSSKSQDSKKLMIRLKRNDAAKYEAPEEEKRSEADQREEEPCQGADPEVIMVDDSDVHDDSGDD
jgi:hypothetical protein